MNQNKTKLPNQSFKLVRDQNQKKYIKSLISKNFNMIQIQVYEILREKFGRGGGRSYYYIEGSKEALLPLV